MSTKAQIEQVDRDIEALMANKKELEVKLESEKKPKLRHGDYGFYNDPYKNPYIHIDVGGKIRPIGRKKSYLDQTSCEPEHIIQGNIFDDLKAIQEDIYEIEISDIDGDKLRIKLVDDEEYVCYITSQDGISLDADMLSALILNLQQLEATIKRSNK